MQVCEALLLTLSIVICRAVQVCEALRADPVDIASMSGALRCAGVRSPAVDIEHGTCCAVQVCKALEADPVDLASMSGALRWISVGLTKELGKIREEAAHSFPIAVKAAKAKPFYDSSHKHLQQLSAAVDHRGPPILTTYSRDDVQVGFATNPTDKRGPPILTMFSNYDPWVGSASNPTDN